MSNFENENENEINEQENNNNNNDNNNNNNNNNNNENNSQNIDELVIEVKNKFDLSDADRNFLNKKINQDEIEEKSLEILLKGKSKKLKAFYRWMEDEIGYKKNKKTKKWSKVKNNNENNNNNSSNDYSNNSNKNNNKKKNLQKNEKKNEQKNVSNDKKLQKVLKIYFGNKNEYELSTYENLIKVSKKINNNNSDDVIQKYLKELIKNKEENKKKNTNINSNNNKNIKLNSKNFVILEYENHNILKKVNENLKLSAYNINKIPEMCEKEGIIKYCKFLEKNIQDFKYIEILNSQQLKKCLIDNKKNSIILYLEEKKVFLYYHRKNIYILNYTNHNNNKVHEYLKQFIHDDKIKNIEEILNEVKNNSLSCICLDYVIFLSLINPKWKFSSINKLIKDVSVEVSDFILYLCQKRVFS